MWIYYETDGDAGWYNVRLFSNEILANRYKKDKNDAYGNTEEIQVDADANPNIPTNVSCPECGGEMVSRTNRQSGNKFWGCKKFPQCKGTRDNEGRSREDREREKEQKEEVNHQEGFSFQKRPFG